MRGPFQFKLEISKDGKSYQPVWDRTGNLVDCDIQQGNWPAARGRYVKLTVTGAPKGVPAGILELTVFGK